MANIEMSISEALKKFTNPDNRNQDDILADYIATIINPGDKTVQIGASSFGTGFVRRGAFHEVVASAATYQSMKVACETHEINSHRLRSNKALHVSDELRGLDAALFAADLGFATMASNWKQVASRLKVGGVIILVGADHGSSARLADALLDDKGWGLAELIAGKFAVFRKITEYNSEEFVPQFANPVEKLRVPVRAKTGLVSGVWRTLFARNSRSV
jgi:hypothetical protein